MTEELEKLIENHPGVKLIYQKNQKYFIAPAKDCHSIEELNRLYYEIAYNLDANVTNGLSFHPSTTCYSGGDKHGIGGGFASYDSNIHLNMGPTKKLVEEDLCLWEKSGSEYPFSLRFTYGFEDVFKNKKDIANAKQHFSKEKCITYKIHDTDVEKLFVTDHPYHPTIQYSVKQVNFNYILKRLIGMNHLTLSRFIDFETKSGKDYYSVDVNKKIDSAVNLLNLTSEEKNRAISLESFNWKNCLAKNAYAGSKEAMKVITLFDVLIDPTTTTFLELNSKMRDIYFKPSSSTIFMHGKLKQNHNLELLIRASNYGPSEGPIELRSNNLNILIKKTNKKSLFKKIIFREKTDYDILPEMIKEEFPLLNFKYGSKISINNDIQNKLNKKICDKRVYEITNQIYIKLIQ